MGHVSVVATCEASHRAGKASMSLEKSGARVGKMLPHGPNSSSIDDVAGGGGNLVVEVASGALTAMFDLMLMEVLHQSKHLNELASSGIPHPCFHQPPQTMDAFGELPVVQGAA